MSSNVVDLMDAMRRCSSMLRFAASRGLPRVSSIDALHA